MESFGSWWRDSGESKHKEVRYLDLHDRDRIDDKPLKAVVRAAVALHTSV